MIFYPYCYNRLIINKIVVDIGFVLRVSILWIIVWRNASILINLDPCFSMSFICSITSDVCCVLFLMDNSLIDTFVFVFWRYVSMLFVTGNVFCTISGNALRLMSKIARRIMWKESLSRRVTYRTCHNVWIIFCTTYYIEFVIKFL
jgi:hypothetical protein